MGGKAPETCWAIHKRQAINLWNCCILLVDLFEEWIKFLKYCTLLRHERGRIRCTVVVLPFWPVINISSAHGELIQVNVISRTLIRPTQSLNTGCVLYVSPRTATLPCRMPASSGTFSDIYRVVGNDKKRSVFWAYPILCESKCYEITGKRSVNP